MIFFVPRRRSPWTLLTPVRLTIDFLVPEIYRVKQTPIYIFLISIPIARIDKAIMK